MPDIAAEDPTPILGTPIIPVADSHQTTLLIDVRGLREAEPGDPAARIHQLLLTIEQNRISFISSRDTDAAVHDVLKRLEEMALILRELMTGAQKSSLPA